MKLRLPKALMSAMAAVAVAVTPMAVTVATGAFAVAAVAAPQVQAELVWGWDSEHNCPTVYDNSDPGATPQDVTYNEDSIYTNTSGSSMSAIGKSGVDLKFTAGNAAQITCGDITARSVWMQSGRYRATGANLAHVGVIYVVGGQLYVHKQTISTRVLIGSSTYSESGHDDLSGASLRIDGGSTVTDVALVEDAKVAVFTGNEGTITTLSLGSHTLTRDGGGTLNIGTLTLTDNATINAAAGTTSITTLSLGGHTLTKRGGSTLGVALDQLVTSGDNDASAKINVQEGTLTVNGTIGNGTTKLAVTAGANGTLSVALTGDTSSTGGGNGDKTTLQVMDGFAGTLKVTSGLLSQSGSFSEGSSLSNAKLNLAGGGVVFDAYQYARTISADIHVDSGNTGYVRVYNSAGNANYENTLAGAVTGSGTIAKTDDGKVAFTGDLSGYTGDIYVQRGTLILRTSSESATFNCVKNENDNNPSLSFEGGKIYNVSRLANDQGTINIEAGTTVNITGTASADTMANAAFMVENMGGKTSHFNIYGKLNSAAAMSVRDGTGELNIENGGELVLQKGLALVNHYQYGSVTIAVKEGGTLTLGNYSGEGFVSADNATLGEAPARLAVTLANGATIAAEAGNTTVDFKNSTVTIASGATVNLKADSDKKLTFEDTKIAGATTLNLKGGGTVGLGKALAVAAGDTATTHTAITGEDSTTLELGSAEAATYKSDVSGEVNMSAKGEGTKTFAGEGSYTGTTSVTGGTLKVTGSISGTSSVAVSDGGVLEVSGADASVVAGGTSLSAIGGSGTAKNISVLDGGHITGATEEGGLKALGEMTKLNISAVAAMEVSHVTMKDVAISAAGQNITYGDNVKAVVASASAEDAGAASMARITGNTESTLTSTAVQTGGTASGTLTVDVDYNLLSAHRGETLKLMVFDNVVMSDGFKLQLGDVLSTIINNGKPEVTLTIDDGTSAVNHTITAADIKSPDYNLIVSAPQVGATVFLTVENIPEPATGTLSVLALAALAARRRRGKKN